MHPQFSEMTVTWFRRAFVYTGSIDEFRYRFDCDEKEKLIHAAVYSNVCYELAQDRVAQDFSWDEAGVAQLKDWLQAHYEAYLKKGGSELYVAIVGGAVVGLRGVDVDFGEDRH